MDRLISSKERLLKSGLDKAQRAIKAFNELSDEDKLNPQSEAWQNILNQLGVRRSYFSLFKPKSYHEMKRNLTPKHK